MVGFENKFAKDDEHMKRRRLHVKLLSAANVEGYRGNCIMPVLEAVLDRLKGREQPPQHFAFARGTRSCVGVQLAHVETCGAVSRLIDRWPGLRLDHEAEAPYFQGYIRAFHGSIERLTWASSFPNPKWSTTLG